MNRRLPDVGVVPAGETRSTYDIWEVPAGSKAVLYAVNNWLEHPGDYRLEFFPDVVDISAAESGASC